jgi:hypothetical protein
VSNCVWLRHLNKEGNEPQRRLIAIGEKYLFLHIRFVLPDALQPQIPFAKILIYVGNKMGTFNYSGPNGRAI